MSSKYIGLVKIIFLIAAIYLIPLIAFSGLAIIRGIPLNKETDPRYVNGLVTASGIFLSLISAAVITKSEDLSVS